MTPARSRSARDAAEEPGRKGSPSAGHRTPALPDVEHPGPDLSARQARIAVAVLSVAGFLLRIFRLGQKPLWSDESLQLSGLQLPVSEIRRHLFSVEYMPPLSYFIQHWFWLPFKTVYAARFPGVLAGTLMIPLAYWAGKRASHRLGGVLAAFFTTVSLYLIYYSQECRGYIFFGAACALLLAQWLDLLLTPVRQRVPMGRWWGLALSGILCGAFHFATLILLPTLGAVATLFLLWDVRRDREQNPPSAAWRRWVAYLVSLAVAALASYAILRYSLNPAWNPMSRVAGGFPHLRFVRVFANSAWGSGWRWLPFLALSGWGLFRSRGTARRVAMACLFLLLLPTVICYLAFPTFLYVSRYLFWAQWCFALLLTLGVVDVAQRVSRPAARLGWLALVLALVALTHVQPLAWYYSSPTKYGADLRAFQRDVEALGDTRLFVLGNGYHIHHLQHYFPTNAIYTPAPSWNTAEEYRQLRVADWLIAVMESFPDIFLYFQQREDASGRVVARAERLFRHYQACVDPPELVRLFRAGFNMIGGTGELETKGIDFRYTRDDEWLEVARSANRTLLLFAGDMPLVTTLDGSLRASLWRVLQQPETLRLFNPDGTNRMATVRWPVACLSEPAALLVTSDDGASPRRYAVPEGTTGVVDPRSRQWTEQKLSVQQVANIGWKAPMQLQRVLVTHTLELRPGVNRLTLTPQGAPLLVGPTDPEFNLVGVP